MKDQTLYSHFRKIDEALRLMQEGMKNVDGRLHTLLVDYHSTRREFLSQAMQSKAIEILRARCAYVNIVPILGPLVSLWIMRDSNINKVSAEILAATIKEGEEMQKKEEAKQLKRQQEREKKILSLREPHILTCRGALTQKHGDRIIKYNIHVAKGEVEQAAPVGNDDKGWKKAVLIATVDLKDKDGNIAEEVEYAWNTWEPGFMYRIWIVGETETGDPERQIRGTTSIFQFPTGAELLEIEGARVAKEKLVEDRKLRDKEDQKEADEQGEIKGDLNVVAGEAKKPADLDSKVKAAEAITLDEPGDDQFYTEGGLPEEADATEKVEEKK